LSVDSQNCTVRCNRELDLFCGALYNDSKEVFHQEKDAIKDFVDDYK